MTSEDSHDGFPPERSPLVVAIFTFFTLGLYGIVWWYVANRDLRDLGNRIEADELDVEPWKSALAISLGLPIIVPAAITLVRTCRRIEFAEEWLGVKPSGPTTNPFSVTQACLLTVIFPAAGFAYLQATLNRAWESERQSAGASTPVTDDRFS